MLRFHDAIRIAVVKLKAVEKKEIRQYLYNILYNKYR